MIYPSNFCMCVFSHQVVSDFSWSHGQQQARPPCPSPSAGVWPSLCPLNWWCHPTLSSSVTLFSYCLQSFPTSGSFPVSQLFPSGGQSIWASASASVLPMSVQGWFPLGWTDLISFLFRGPSRVFSSTKVQNINSSALCILHSSTLISIHDYWKTTALTIWTSVGKVMSLLFKTLSRFVISFLPISKWVFFFFWLVLFCF